MLTAVPACATADAPAVEAGPAATIALARPDDKVKGCLVVTEKLFESDLVKGTRAR